MKKLKTWYLLLFLTVFALLLLSNCKKEEEPSFVYEYGSFTDTRDGHVYKTIEIRWVILNMKKIHRYPNGNKSTTAV